MNKRLTPRAFIISLSLIFLISLVFIFILYKLVNPDAKKLSLLESLPITTAPVSFDLEIGSPDDQTLVFDKSILVSGKASPGAVVLVSTSAGDSVVPVNTAGEFTKVLALSPGLNSVTVSAFDSQGNTKQFKRTIYYSEEKI